MDDRREIIICLGSSCFSRGNKTIVQIIKKYLNENKLEESVYFHGAHCFNLCEKGPVVKIDDKLYTEVSTENIKGILEEEFSL
jgi:NADH:ubiquinone oxidoreductase subunit E